jgi:hypothetical protein
MIENNGSAPAGNPAPGAGGESGTGDQPWYGTIADDGLRGYAQTKGFKDPAAVLESYRNFEKLQGVPQDRLLKLPEKDDDPAWGDIYGKLGRPSDPTGYQLQFEGDSALADRFAKTFHEAGISKSQAARLNTEWNAYVQELIEGDERERAQRSGAELAELRGKWGAKFDENAELGRRAAREFGVAEDDFKQLEAALGTAKSLELFQRIGSRLGEAKSFDAGAGGGASNGFSMTPEQARARMEELRRDADWTAAYLNGDAAKKAEADRLHRIMAGEA